MSTIERTLPALNFEGWLPTAAATRRLGISPSWLDELAKRPQPRGVRFVQSPCGCRLFWSGDLERVAAERQART